MEATFQLSVGSVGEAARGKQTQAHILSRIHLIADFYPLLPPLPLVEDELQVESCKLKREKKPDHSDECPYLWH